MTRELLQEANNLNHAIIEIEEQIHRAEVIRQSNRPLRISTSTSTTVSVTIDDAKLIADITNMVVARLNQVKEDMYNRLLAL